MRPTPLERRAVAVVAAALMAGLLACPPTKPEVAPRPQSRAAIVSESVAVLSTPLTTISSAEHETDTGPNRPTVLGGRYDQGTVVNMNNRKTPELQNELTTSTPESEFRQYLDQLYYDMSPDKSEVAALPCVKPSGSGTVPCTPPDEAAIVYIEPEIGMLRWQHSKIPENGIVVARIINYDRSGRTEERYGFPPGAHTWWVVDMNNGVPRSRFVVRNYDGTIGILRNREWPFYRCGHKDADPTTRISQARFWDCANSNVDTLAFAPRRGTDDLASYVHLAAFHPGAPEPLPHLPLAVRADTWVTCAEGCCIAGP